MEDTQQETAQIVSIEEKKESRIAAEALKVDGLMQVMPSNFNELYRYAQVLSRSDLVPKDYRGKPDNVVVAIQYGAEIGLKPLQAMQGIAVINGRPTLWGDHFLAVIRASGALESIVETDDGKEATCIVRRKGESNTITRTFSIEDAKTAGLWGKQGPWTNYPKRMRQMRARAFACRDAFADVLKGFGFTEEAQDAVEIEAAPVADLTALMPKRASAVQEQAEKVFVAPVADSDGLPPFDLTPSDFNPLAKISKEQVDILRNAIIKHRRQADAFNDFIKSECGAGKIENLLSGDFNKVLKWIETD